jgi:hypothetical protein
MVTFTETFHCKSRLHCQACRNDAAFRASLLRAGLVSERDFPCLLRLPIDVPLAIPKSDIVLRGKGDGGAERAEPPKSLGLGDIVEAMAKPIARALKLDCLDAQHNLKPQSRCAQRRARLNRIQF